MPATTLAKSCRKTFAMSHICALGPVLAGCRFAPVVACLAPLVPAPLAIAREAKHYAPSTKPRVEAILLHRPLLWQLELVEKAPEYFP